MQVKQTLLYQMKLSYYESLNEEVILKFIPFRFWRSSIQLTISTLSRHIFCIRSCPQYQHFQIFIQESEIPKGSQCNRWKKILCHHSDCQGNIVVFDKDMAAMISKSLATGSPTNHCLKPLKVLPYGGDKTKFEEYWGLFESLVHQSKKPANLKMVR